MLVMRKARLYDPDACACAAYTHTLLCTEAMGGTCMQSASCPWAAVEAALPLGETLLRAIGVRTDWVHCA